MRVVLIGCGRIAHRHATVISELQDSLDISLAGACEIDTEKGRAFSEKHRVKVYSEIIEAINECKPDIVSILTESGNHAKHASLILKQGVSVIVEKPAALSAHDVSKLDNLAKSNNATFYTVKQNRFNKPIMLLKQLIEEDKLGQILLVTSRVRWMRDDKYYKQARWRGTKKLDGGVIANQASHHLDMMVWIGGRVKKVNGVLRRFMAPIECEDTALATIEFEKGCIGAFEATTCTRQKDLEGSISVLGTKGSCVVSGFAMNRLESLSFTGQENESIEINKYSTNPPDVYGFGHIEFYKALFNHFSNGISHRSIVVGDEALHTVEVMNALYNSNERGTWVEPSVKDDYFERTLQ